MNLPNKITVTRIILSMICLLMLAIPFYEFGFEFPTYLVGGKVLIDLKNICKNLILSYYLVLIWF